MIVPLLLFFGLVVIALVVIVLIVVGLLVAELLLGGCWLACLFACWLLLVCWLASTLVAIGSLVVISPFGPLV